MLRWWSRQGCKPTDTAADIGADTGKQAFAAGCRTVGKSAGRRAGIAAAGSVGERSCKTTVAAALAGLVVGKSKTSAAGELPGTSTEVETAADIHKTDVSHGELLPRKV